MIERSGRLARNVERGVETAAGDVRGGDVAVGGVDLAEHEEVLAPLLGGVREVRRPIAALVAQVAAEDRHRGGERLTEQHRVPHPAADPDLAAGAIQGEAHLRVIALARDVYTYLHLPMVAGIVLFAFALKTTLAHVGNEVALDVRGAVTQRAVLDAVESAYPMLRGTIRDRTTQERRAFIRFFACQQDLSHESPDTPLPDDVASGKEPFLVIGAIAGG